MTPEVRAGGELRVAGRTLTGRAMVYGTMSEEHRERFAPGAFAPVPAVPLLLQHDRSMVIVEPGGFDLVDTEQALEVRAELPPKAAALQLVRGGALTGFSVKFRPRHETRDGNIRVVEKAELVEVSVVDQPSYPASTAEVRRRGDRGGRLGTMFGGACRRAGKVLDCRCADRATALEAVFEKRALDNALHHRQAARGAGPGRRIRQSAIASSRADAACARFWAGREGRPGATAVDIPSNTERGRDAHGTP